MSEIRTYLTGEADAIEPLDNGERGIRLRGLHAIKGTFEGTIFDGLNVLEGYEKGPMEVYFYGPDPDLPWWKHWFYRFREWLALVPYPTVVLAHGPATFKIEEEQEDDEDIVISGSFTSAGIWQFKDKEVNP